MQIYNSLTRKIEIFTPNEPLKVKMYTCGPTVYNYAHIGNYRSYIFEDILQRALEYVGYDVQRVMNITDIGHLSGDSDNGKDKMIEKAKAEDKSVLKIAEFYTKEFKKGFDELNLNWPETVIPATQCVDVYIKMIDVLLKKGYAYESGNNIYFDISKLEKYNVFSNQNSEDLKVAVREEVSNDVNKKNPGDFALWFTKSKFENHALKWNSPWGEGYPGWHIECSGISYKYLGEYLDIHCGGIDNKFPHHTNEIAQSESFLGHKWCNYWFHILHLNLKNGKMSKTGGNFITLNDLKKSNYNPLSFKLMCLQSHYRKEMTFTFEALDASEILLKKVKKKVTDFKCDKDIEISKCNVILNEFIKAINNDLNTSMMITIMLDVIKSKELNDSSKKFILEEMDKVLGLKLFETTETEMVESLDSEILQKIELRNKAKKEKNYKLADEIRNELYNKGIELLDTREGTKYKKI